MSVDNSTVEARLAALERQVATLRGALAAVGLAGAAGVAFAGWAMARHQTEELPVAATAPVEEEPRELRVQKLTIVDDQDKPRAELGLAADGAVALSMRAPDGSLRLTLQSHEFRAGLSTFGERGVTRTWHGWSRTEEQPDQAAVQLMDRAGLLRLHLHASDTVPGMTLLNETGVPLEAVPR